MFAWGVSGFVDVYKNKYS